MRRPSGYPVGSLWPVRFVTRTVRSVVLAAVTSRNAARFNVRATRAMPRSSAAVLTPVSRFEDAPALGGGYSAFTAVTRLGLEPPRYRVRTFLMTSGMNALP